MEKYMRITTCPSCKGNKLKPELLAVTVGGKNIMEFCDMSVSDAVDFVEKNRKTQKTQKILKSV